MIRRQSAMELLIPKLPSVILDHWFHYDVCQGRLDSPKYDSNPDLSHWMLWALGCRNSRILSRTDADHGLQYIPDSVGKLISGAQRMAAWVPFRLGMEPNAGDIIICGSMQRNENQRVCIFLSADSDEWVVAVSGISNRSHHQFAEIQKVKLQGDLLVWHDLKLKINGWVDLEKVEF